MVATRAAWSEAECENLDQAIPDSAALHPGYACWQRRFWEHAIRDDEDFSAHIDYVHFNPVKHGYVHEPAAWPYSTFKFAVRRGLYSESWLGPVEQSLPYQEWGE